MHFREINIQCVHGVVVRFWLVAGGQRGGVEVWSLHQIKQKLSQVSVVWCASVCAHRWWWVSGYNIPHQWIGRGSVKPWPPRSPDLTPLDFYLWDYVKQHVYSERINDINHLKQRITDVIHSVTPDILNRVWEELEYRLDACRATNGSHIELHWIGMKLGEFSFYSVKSSHFYLVSLISCGWSGVHRGFVDTLYIIIIYITIKIIPWHTEWVGLLVYIVDSA